MVLSCFQSLNSVVGNPGKETGTGIWKGARDPVHLGQCLVPALPYHVAGEVSLLCVFHKQYFGSAHLHAYYN